MSSLSGTPFSRILPAFCFGTAASFYALFDVQIANILFLVGSSGLIYFLTGKSSIYSNRFYIGILLQITFFVLGYSLTDIKDQRKSELHFTNYKNVNYFLGKISNSPVDKNGRIRAIVEIISVSQNGRYSSSTGKCYVYFKNDSLAAKLCSGDKIVFTGNLIEIQSPLNPGQFDFKKYSSLKRIYHQVHLRQNEWRTLVEHKKFNLERISENLRDKFLRVYKDAGLSGQEYAVLSALVLGYDDEIDSQTMQAFSASGTLHILSVSGMHVGLIFTALSVLLKFMERKRSTRIIRIILLLLTLWFYAILTGLSSSVIRSAMMFSFILIGSSMNRSSNIYNSLLLSAFCIFIFFDPLMLFDIGLQLSFLAVGGIAYLYSKIYKCIYFKNFILDKAWALIAVSIAAQLATFALSIYYFHQFPNYFIPANLVIIPLSTAGIFAGIILLLISPFNFVYLKAGWVIQKLIHLLNASALFVENMPGSVWGGISINIFDFLVINAILLSLIIYLENISVVYLYSIQVFVILLVSSFTLSAYLTLKRKNIIFFSSTHSMSLQVNIRDESLLLFKSSDSTSVIKISDSYCYSEGIPLSKRAMICLDTVNSSKHFGKIFVSNNSILIGDTKITEVEKESDIELLNMNNQPDIIYIKKSLLNDSSYYNKKARLILVNDKGNRNLPEFKDYRSKIYFLSQGAKIVEL